ncbi:MAG: LamG-like jellyroll fold domain-containing protein [Verrucomicrobiota bacterium]
MKKSILRYWYIISLLCLGAATASATLPEKDNVPCEVEGDAIVRHNGVFFNNRPLYNSQGRPSDPYYWVFGGDRPLLRFGGDPWLDGTFVAGFQRADGTSKWLLDFKSVEFRYYGGRSEWRASDPAFPGVTIELHELPLGRGTGLAAQARVHGAAAGDRLVWMLGCAHYNPYVKGIDALDENGPRVRQYGFTPAEAEGNRVEIQNGVVRIEPQHYPQGKFRYTLAACSAPTDYHVADADQWATPAGLLASTGSKRPMACGVTPLNGETPVTWICRAWQNTETEAAPPKVAEEFHAAWERVEELNRRVICRTPDARLDFMMRAMSSVIDGIWRTEAYGDGGTSTFPNPLLGWRNNYGGTVYGWHDRVLTAAKHFFASQVTKETYLDHPELRDRIEKNKELSRYDGSLSHPGKDPRFHSKGRLIPDENSTMYDMQSQFFDQMIEDWRFTADPEMEKTLRPALELHLDYIARCFDPDGDGAYESLPNTMLTDTVWFNGGGTPEETAFAYRGHQAARDMARRAGDEAAVRRHEAKLALIRKGFFGKLWVDHAGHPGAYREQGGHQRLHEEEWLPGIVLTLDCPGLLNFEQMASSLHFTEYGQQRERLPRGGVRVWPSNWVPAVWSNRLLYSGEEFHLALGYCFAGMPEGALEIIHGSVDALAFDSGVPGNLGTPYNSCGVDFSDNVTTFARAMVSGIFGYRPDRPNGLVTMAPQFPAAWDHAELSTPEFSLAYQRTGEGTEERLRVRLAQASAMELQVPFRGGEFVSVTLNGQPVKHTTQPGFGRSICVVRTPSMQEAEVVVKCAPALPKAAPQFQEVDINQPVQLALENAAVLEVQDAQKVLSDVKIADGRATARIANNPGVHRVLLLAKCAQGAPQYRIMDFKVHDRADEAFAAEKNLRQAPAGVRWTGIDLSGVRNGRVSELFRQEYLSPRPDTISTRLARDGYGIWNHVYTGKLAPGIDLSNTQPRRPVPVYDAELGTLKVDQELTLEAWVQADLSDAQPWSTTPILFLGDLSLNFLNSGGRLMRMFAPESIFVGTSNISGARLTHVAVVLRSGKPGMLYYDGKKVLVETLPVDFSKVKFGELLRLGADLKGGSRLLGRIARVAVSKRAATEAELQHRTLETPPLAGAWADWSIPVDGPAQVDSKVPGAPALVRQSIPFHLPKTLGEPLPVVDGMLEVPQRAKFKWNIGDKNIAFTSLWDNWPRKVTVPVNRKGDSVWLLVAGSTNPMQVRIANAVLRFEYADGKTETLDLVNPMNFWSLCPFFWSDYDYREDAFALPKEAPAQVQLGSNCRAMVYGWKLRPGVELKGVTLESLSQEVVIGLMGVSLCNPQ